MTDVIDFNKVKQKREEERFDQITEDIRSDEEKIAEIATTATMQIVDALIYLGYPVEKTPSCIKDILGTIECIRALAYRAKDLETPIHAVNDTLYGFIDDEASLLDDFLADMEENVED